MNELFCLFTVASFPIFIRGDCATLYPGWLHNIGWTATAFKSYSQRSIQKQSIAVLPGNAELASHLSVLAGIRPAELVAKEP